jgi:hypothetical protein
LPIRQAFDKRFCRRSAVHAARARWFPVTVGGAMTGKKGRRVPMKTFAMAFTLAAILGRPTLVFADEFKPGDRVEANAAFFMCASRDDLAAMKTLARQGDRDTAVKVGTERCEQGQPGNQYVVVEVADDLICVRRGTDPYCLWVQRSSLHAANKPQG